MNTSVRSAAASQNAPIVATPQIGALCASCGKALKRTSVSCAVCKRSWHKMCVMKQPTAAQNRGDVDYKCNNCHHPEEH